MEGTHSHTEDPLVPSWAWLLQVDKHTRVSFNAVDRPILSGPSKLGAKCLTMVCGAGLVGTHGKSFWERGLACPPCEEQGRQPKPGRGPVWGLVVGGSSRKALDVSLTQETGKRMVSAPVDGLGGRQKPRNMTRPIIMRSAGPDGAVQPAGAVCLCYYLIFSLTFSAVDGSHMDWRLLGQSRKIDEMARRRWG